MKYIPHTQDEIQSMLKTIGVGELEDLFPQALKQKEEFNLENPYSELEIKKKIAELTSLNHTPHLSFLGGGAYKHDIPEIVNVLSSRSEFATAYTPYQPEASQGTLQSLFEFQTMMANLTGMEVSNASMYDGATACAEALLMTLRLQGSASRFERQPIKMAGAQTGWHRKILIAQNIHPRYLSTCLTYLKEQHIEIETIPYHRETGQLDLTTLTSKLKEGVASLLVQSPNYFGVIEPLKEIGQACKNHETLFVTAVSDPTSLALFEPPGSFGADIVVGEAQALGNPVSFGGPYVGFFTTKMDYVRQMPGRVVGESVDLEGKRAFTLTLSTREQHIRREKATSNICTNQNLCALRTSIYLATLGKQGLKEVAEQSYSKTEYAKEKFSELPHVHIVFNGPTYNEFVYKTPLPHKEVFTKLQQKNIIGGLLLKEGILCCVTETTSKDDIDRYRDALRGILK